MYSLVLFVVVCGCLGVYLYVLERNDCMKNVFLGTDIFSSFLVIFSSDNHDHYSDHGHNTTVMS